MSFRGSMIASAVILIGCGMWILCAEFFRSGIRSLPVDIPSASLAAGERENASLAASIGIWRGDLWAETAYTYALFLWQDPGRSDRANQLLDQARRNAEVAVSKAPHNAGAWLLLAGLSAQFNSAAPGATAALKMSYYTGPSETSLIPLRLSIATHSNALNDTEIQQFVQRDLHIIFSTKPDLKPAILTAYRGASPEGRRNLVEAIRDIDPAFAQMLSSQRPDEISH